MGRMYGVCRWLQAPCRSQKTGVAQLVERATFNRVVKGSIPFTGIIPSFTRRKGLVPLFPKVDNGCVCPSSQRLIRTSSPKPGQMGSDKSLVFYTSLVQIQSCSTSVVCPSSQRGRSQEPLRKLRGCESHRNQNLFGKVSLHYFSG